MEHALTGLRVLDLTHHIAGPYCTKLLADFGADVIKVERPDGGDPARAIGPFPNDEPHPEKSGLFLHLNTNKRSITLNLAHPEGRALALRLAATADILVENFRPGTLERFGLTEAALRAVRPSLTITRISNFGQTGPYRDYPATELTLFALSGRMSLMGEGEREPVKYGGNVVQYLAGANAASATMAAWWGYELHGIAQTVDVSILRAIMGAADNRLLAYSYTHEVPHRADTTGAGYIECADGHVQFPTVPARPSHFTRLVRLLEQPELATDPRFATPADRIRNRPDLEAIVRAWLLTRKKVEIAEAAQAVGVFAAPVLNVQEVLENPHHAARGAFVPLAHPDAGTWTYPGAPFRMQQTPWTVARPAPRLGEHNAAIYGEELGLSAAEQARLKQAGVI